MTTPSNEWGPESPNGDPREVHTPPEFGSSSPWPDPVMASAPRELPPDPSGVPPMQFEFARIKPKHSDLWTPRQQQVLAWLDLAWNVVWRAGALLLFVAIAAAVILGSINGANAS